MNIMKKKNVLAVSMMLVTTLLLAGCGAGGEKENPSADVTEQTAVTEPTSSDEKTEEPTPTPTEEPEVSAVVTAIREAQVGDVITMGTYEQDGDTANGAEPIEWQVLADEGGKKLLLSKYILMPLGNYMYDTFPGDGVNFTWAECGVRKMLNGQFYEEAFTDEEQALILETPLRTTWNDALSLGAQLVDVQTETYEMLGKEFTNNIGKLETVDKIFIPDSKEELDQYMKIENGSWYIYGTDLLAVATPASEVVNSAYNQGYFDEAVSVCGEGVNLDSSLVGKEFGSYLLRNGMSVIQYLPTNEVVNSTAFYVINGSMGGGFSPYYLWELFGREDLVGCEDVGIRPEMWVSAE